MKKSELEEKFKILETQLSDILREAHNRGEHLINDVFIPQYLGFEETVITEEDSDAVKARIYTKKGFNISRPVQTDHPKWIIMDPRGVTNAVHMYNMHSAIIVLQACGMDVSMEDYNDENKKAAEKFLKDIEGVDEVDLLDGPRAM